MKKSSVAGPDVLGTGLDALAIGGGTAAIVALIRQQVEANRQRKAKEEREKEEIDPNTVVLRLSKPAKTSKKAEAPKITVKPTVEGKEVRPLSEGQLRDTAGRFATVDDSKGGESKTDKTLSTKTPPEKKAGYSWDIMNGTGSILAAGGGAVLGYYLVSKLTRKMEQNRLKKQIAAAQTEYLDLLDGRNVKKAESFGYLFAFSPNSLDLVGEDDKMSKEAGLPTDFINMIKGIPDTAKKSSSTALAAYILMAGGTAYVVKKYLEDRFGSRRKEEEPEKQTRILFKAGSSEFEIPPGSMLATLGILRDCITDSIPPGVKTAYDYSFLKDISDMDGGKQWILDMYAKQNGLNRDNMADFKMPMSTMMKYHGTMGDIAKNPDKHRAAIQGYVMNMMQKDPKGWFDLLGQKQNGDLVKMKADEQIANMSNNGGFTGFLTKIPLLGDLLKKFMSWFSSNTKWGRKITARKTLEGMGMSTDMANNVLKGYDFSTPGQWTRIPEQAAAQNVKQPAKTAPSPGNYNHPPFNRPLPLRKAAAWDDDLAAFISRRKMLADASNMDVIKAIESLKKENAKKTEKRHDDQDTPKVSVQFDDDIGSLLSDEDKQKIVSSLTK